MAHRDGKPQEERRLLHEAVDAGTASASLLMRLAQVEMAAGETASAAERLQEAADLLPRWALVWLMRGQVELQRGDREAARAALERAVAFSPRARRGNGHGSFSRSSRLSPHPPAPLSRPLITPTRERGESELADCCA